MENDCSYTLAIGSKNGNCITGKSIKVLEIDTKTFTSKLEGVSYIEGKGLKYPEKISHLLDKEIAIWYRKKLGELEVNIDKNGTFGKGGYWIDKGGLLWVNVEEGENKWV
jgi:hypothetical protein